MLDLWAERLLPYLDADPHMSIAKAIDRYKHEHPIINESR